MKNTWRLKAGPSAIEVIGIVKGKIGLRKWWLKGKDYWEGIMWKLRVVRVRRRREIIFSRCSVVAVTPAPRIVMMIRLVSRIHLGMNLL